MTTPGTITLREVVSGGDNPAYQVSQDEWNDTLVVGGGSDGDIMVRDSLNPDGWGWVPFTTVSPITTRGDLIVGDASGLEVRLPVGATGTVLYSNGTDPAWSASPTLTRLYIGNGTAAAPSFAEASNTGFGLYWASSAILTVAAGGTGIFCWVMDGSVSEIRIGSGYRLGWAPGAGITSGADDVYFARVGAGQVGVYNDATHGIMLDVVTDALLKVRNRGNSAYAGVDVDYVRINNGGAISASSGAVRVPSANGVVGRNNGNSGNISMLVTTTGDIVVLGDGTYVTRLVGSTVYVNNGSVNTWAFNGLTGDFEVAGSDASYSIGSATKKPVGVFSVRYAAYSADGLTGYSLNKDGCVTWTSHATDPYTGADAGLKRFSASMVKVTNGGAGFGGVQADSFTIQSFFKGTGTTSTSGELRLKNLGDISARNQGNSGNIALIQADTNDRVQIGDSTHDVISGRNIYVGGTDIYMSRFADSDLGFNGSAGASGNFCRIRPVNNDTSFYPVFCLYNGGTDKHGLGVYLGVELMSCGTNGIIYFVTATTAAGATRRWAVNQAGHFVSINHVEMIKWGETNAYPALKNNGGELQVRDGADGGYMNLRASTILSDNNIVAGASLYVGGNAATDTLFSRAAATIIAVTSTFEFTEVSAPVAPAANKVRLYAVDNGAGKTQLMAIFSSGAAQQVAIEP